MFGKTLSELKNSLASIKTQGLANSIFNTATINIRAVENYNQAIKNGVSCQQALETASKGANRATIALMQSANGATVSTEALTAAQKSSTLAVQAQSLALKGVAIAGNMIAFMAISTAISAAVTKINSYVNAASEAKQSSEALAQKMREFDSSASGNAKTLDSLNDKYKELSKGVNKLGENVSLSSSEYEEYKDIIRQVHEIMPDVAVNFNSQGEAIAFTTDKITDLTKAYDEYRKKANNDFLSQGDGEGNTVKDIIDTYNNQSDRAWYDNLWQRTGSFLKSTFTGNLPLEEYLEQLGKSNREKKEFYEELQNFSQEDFYTGFGSAKPYTSVLGYDVVEISRMSSEEFNEFKKMLQQEVNKYGQLIESASDNMKEIITRKIGASDKYYTLKDKKRDNILSMVSGLNDSLLQELGINSETTAGEFAEKLISEFSNNKTFAKAFNGLFNKSLDKLSVSDYVAKVRDLINVIGNELNLTDDGKNILLGNLGFDNLDELVNDYNSAISSAMEKWQLDDIGKDDLEKFFQENSINTEKEIDAWKEVAEEANNAAEAKQKYLSTNSLGSGQQALSELQESYKSVSENIESLTSVLSESVSGTGLTTDSIDTVTSIFSDLKGYDEEKLLDKTANGIRLNTKELEKLKKEYDDKTAKEFYDDVTDAYNAWQDALRSGQEQSVTDDLYNQYQQIAQLADQYVGLTSAYNKWQNALSTANEGSMYDSIYDNIKSVKELYEKGLIGTDDFRTFTDLISPKDLSGASTDEVVRAYQASIGKIERYFTEGHEGAMHFLEDVNKINSAWAHMNKDGNWEIDFNAGGTTDKDVAKKLGIDVEAVQAILRKLIDYGFDIDLESSFDSINMLGQSADKAYAKLKKLGKVGKNTSIKFDTGNIAEVNSQIEHAEKLLNKFKNKDGSVNLNIEGASEAQSVMIKLLTEKQELEKPAILTVNTSELSGKSASVITMLQKIQQDINTYDVQVAVGADTTGIEKTINKDIKAIKSNYSEELANINIKLANIDAARQELSTLTADDIEVMVNAIVNRKEVDAYKKEKEEKTLKVNCEVNDTAVNAFMAKPLEKTIRIKANVDYSESGVKADASAKQSSGSTKKKKSSGNKASVDGTFNLLQSSLVEQGFANASGNISIPKDQTSLINELGEELIVRNGRWFTVKGGAQFTELKKGDIIFNHKQTQQLLKNGKISSTDNRGKTAFSSGSGHFSSWLSSSSSKSKSSSKKSSSSSSSSKSSSSKSSKEDSKQTIDWLDRAIEVTTNKIDLLKSKLENIFAIKRSNKTINKELKETTKLITDLGKKADKYKKKANKVKLSSKLKKAIQNNKITENYEELVKKYGIKKAQNIKEYRNSYNKYQKAEKSQKEAKANKRTLKQERAVNNGHAGKYFKKYNKQIKSYEKTAKKYEKKADKVKLSDKFKKLIQDSKIAGSYDELAKAYGKKKASQIAKYQNYYNKYQKAEKSKQKAVEKKQDLKQQVINSSTVKKRNVNIDQQIKLTTELIKDYGKAVKTYAAKAKSVDLSEDLKKLVRNGKIKGSHKDLIKEYGEKTAEKIEEYKDYYDKYKEAKKSKAEAKTQKRELKQQKQQNIIDDAQARIEKLNAQAENQGSAKEKNKYLEKSVKWIKESYAAQIKLAKLEKDSVKVAQLKAEKEKELRDLKIQQHENLQNEYDSYVSLYSTEAENAKTARDKEAAIKNQIQSTKDSYKEQIAIANLEKNPALVKELKIKKKSEILDLNAQILQNYADEHNASANLASTQAQSATSLKEKNWYEQQTLESTIKEYKYLYQIAKLKGDMVEMARLEAEIQNIANDSAKAQFENISTEYQHKLDELDRKSQFINHQISLTEAKNGFITSELYEKLIDDGKEYIEMLQQEKSVLEDNFKNVAVGSDQWYEMRDMIYSVDEAIQSTNESIAENTQKVRETKRELEDLGRGVIDELKSEADFYIKILSYKDMFDQDTGAITKEGSATLALHAVNVSNGIAQNKIIQKQIEDLDKDYMSDSGMAFNDYYERRKELIGLQQDYILGCYEEMDAIRELCKDGYDKQKDAMDDLINKYKKALDAERNLRDYENKIEDTTSDIASIKKQIKALEGNMTEEARAKLQKLTVQLREAEKDLEDTEYDKYISDQQDMLDNLMDEFENFVDNQLADLEGLVEKVISAMPDSASVVNNTLNEIAAQWGIELTNALDASTLAGDYSTIADQTSETATIAQLIYAAMTGNYNTISGEITALSGIAQDMLTWMRDNNFAKDVTEAISRIQINVINPYTNTGTAIPNITDSDVNNTWDNNTSLSNNGGIGTLHTFNENVISSAKDLSDTSNGNTHTFNWDAASSEKDFSGVSQETLKNIHSSNTNTINAGKNTTPGALDSATVNSNNSLSAAVEGNTKKQNKKLNSAIDFISANAKKPSDEKKKSLSDDPLNKYIYSKTNKVLNNANSKELAKILGVDTKDSAWKTNAKKALKNIGYSQGGIIETLQKVPGETGDDGWAVLKKGEAVLNLKQTDMFNELLNQLPSLNSYMNVLPDLHKNNNTASTKNEGNVNIGDISFNIDGSKVHDLESLKREIQNDKKFRNFMTDVVLSQVSSGKSFTYMRY